MSFDEIPPPPSPPALTADRALLGRRFTPLQQVLLYSASEWELFVHEWAHECLKQQYISVHRFSGAGDKGIDIAGFVDDGLFDVWDNYQCKHYGPPLRPSDIWIEVGKVLWYSFKKHYAPPRAYYFVAPKDVGTKLLFLLKNPARLKAGLKEHWTSHCSTAIERKTTIKLDGEFAEYVESFDFSKFRHKPVLEIIGQHAVTPYHAQRFGGGLPDRPDAGAPPDNIDPGESRYVAKLLAAYADHKGCEVKEPTALNQWTPLRAHFSRQREAFYHAEGLRVFARASVPEGTFDSLQEDIHAGVINECEGSHADGYARVVAVTKTACELQLTSNALLVRTHVKDRIGICHQLANDDRLEWTKEP